MVPKKNRDQFRALGLLALGLPALGLMAVWLLLTLFSDLLSGTAIFAFRDVAHFYRPLAHYLQFRSTETSFPLWSSLDSFGVPLAGETTTALFYPPRILLAGLLPPDSALAAYVFLHLLWSGIGVFRLASHFIKNPYATSIAAFSYASSGPIFFLYTNPPFLVGASWLPWIFLFLIKGSQCQFPTATVPLILAACSIAMSILGGDPQTAVHVILVWLLWRACTFVVYHGSLKLRGGRSTLQAMARPSPWFWQSWFRQFLQSDWFKLGFIIMLASCLAMPQLVAGLSWSSQSHRSATRAANVYDWLGSAVSKSVNQKSPTSESTTLFPIRRHSDQVNDFSVAPWHLPQLVSPYLAGKPFPIHSRITKLLPNEPRMWTPTLYCGIFPGFCLLLSLFRPRLWSPWLLTALLACGFALGQFGLYWLLVTFVPGYGQFRFPAKWLPLVALGLCLHSAHLLNFVKPQNLPAIIRTLLPILLALAGLFVVTFVPRFETSAIAWISHHNHTTVDAYWGSFRPAQWLLDFRLSLLQTVCFLMIGLIICGLVHLKKLTSRTMWFILLAMCIVESQLTASWQLLKIPHENLVSNPAAIDTSTDSGIPLATLAKRYLLTQTENPTPASWTRTSDPNRVIEVQAFERQTWVGRWHLASGVASLNNPVSIPSHRTVLFWAAINHQLKQLSPAQQREALTSIARYLSVQAIARRSEGKLTLYAIENPYPFARFHQQWLEKEPISSQSLGVEFADLLSRIVQNEEMLPCVELDSMTEQDPPGAYRTELESSQSSPPVLSEFTYGGDAFSFNISTLRPGLLQLMQYQDGHWRAELLEVETGQSIVAPVYRCDIVSQAIFIPKGNWQVRMYYNPGWLWPSFILQITAAIACLLTWIGFYPSRLRPMPSNKIPAC